MLQIFIQREGVFIFTKFLNLEKDKQQRILNAALKEFAQKGYDDASTIEIAKAAGISKGLLFHYFKTKKDLFLYLFDYSTKILKTEYFGLINTNERDIFERMRQSYILKTELIHKHPFLFEFISKMVSTESPEVKDELEPGKKELLSIGYAMMVHHDDESKFKDGIDVKKAKNIIFWSIGGFAGGIQEELNKSGSDKIDYDKILDEFDDYLKMLRDWFYK